MKQNIKIQKVLKIYLDNTDKYNDEALWKYIVDKVHSSNLAGATVYKAVAGVGNHKTLHTFELLNLSVEMPLIIEIIDSSENINRFLELIEPALHDVFATLQDIEAISFKG